MPSLMEQHSALAFAFAGPSYVTLVSCQTQALMCLLFIAHCFPSPRPGSLPRQHLDMNPCFLSVNPWSFWLITTQHSSFLCRQLGHISLDAVHLMSLMFMPHLSLWLTDTFFLYYHAQTMMLSQTLPLKCCSLKFLLFQF